MTTSDPDILHRASPAFPVVVSGPSGVGKTVLVNRLLELDPGLVRSTSATTRPRREGEVDGVHYYFYEMARFKELIRGGGLLEWARVHEYLYGTPRAPLESHLAAGRGVVLNIDVQGAAQLRRALPRALLIFVLPPSMGELEARLRRRGTDSDPEIATRLANAAGEIAQAANYEYTVVNDDVDRTGRCLAAIVEAERHRTERLVDTGRGV